MWGDEFAYWADDYTRQVDDNIRQLNEWWQTWGMPWLRWIGAEGRSSAFPVLPFANATWRLLVGENPRADENTLRDLAEFWTNEATKSAEIAQEAARAGMGVQVVWLGDGAPFVFSDQLRQIALSLNGLALTQANIAQGVNQFVIQVVRAKAAFRAQVIMLLFEIVMALAFAVPSLGTSLVAAAGRKALTLAAIRVTMRVLLTQLRTVGFKSFLREVGRTTLRGVTPTPRLRIPPGAIARNPTRLAPNRPPTTPRPAAPRSPLRMVVNPVRAAGRAARHPVRAVRAAGQRVTHRMAGTAANRTAQGLQRNLVRNELRRMRDVVRSGGRVTADDWARLSRMRSGDFRRALADDLARGLRGRPTAPARGLGSGLDDLVRVTSRNAVDNGLTTWGQIGRAALGYGGRSALTYGTAGYAIQEGITHLSLNSMGVQGYQSSAAGLAGSLAGAALGGAPLAMGTRLPSMMVLGGVGGGLGFYGAQVAELAFTPGADWSRAWDEALNPGLLLRAGGAGGPWEAILQGAVGGAWERGIGEYADFGGARANVADLRTAINAGPLTASSNVPTFNLMNVDSLLSASALPQPPATPIPAMSMPGLAAPVAPTPAAAGTSAPAGPAGSSPASPASTSQGTGGDARPDTATPPGPAAEPPAGAGSEANDGGHTSDPPAATVPDAAGADGPVPAQEQPATPAEVGPDAGPPPSTPSDGSTAQTAPPGATDAPESPPRSGTAAADTSTSTSTSTTVQVGDAHYGDAQVLSAPERPNEITLSSQSEGQWPAPVPEQVDAVREQAMRHPGEPSHWKPVEGGWLAQGTHDGTQVVVLVDENGVVQDVESGSFADTTRNSPRQTAGALYSLLPADRVTDPAAGVFSMTLPSGATVDVQFGLDRDLPEGQSYVAPGSFELTPAGWQQTGPARVVLSTTVRADPAESLSDLHRTVVGAMAQIDAGLPGPVGEGSVRPEMGRTDQVAGMRPGDVWQAPPTSTSVEVTAPPGTAPAADAGERLTAALADLQSGGDPSVVRPVVALTGNPGQGPKLAHFADGSTVTFTIETAADLAPGAVEVSPATWVYDGQDVRQAAQPAQIRISGRLPVDADAASRQISAMVEAGLRELHGALPGQDRPHLTHNLLDLRRLGAALNPAAADGADNGRTTLTPDLTVTGTPTVVAHLPGTAGFAAEAQAALNALAGEGFRLSQLRTGSSEDGGPGLLVRVEPPADPILPARPVELRLAYPEGTDTAPDGIDRVRLPSAEDAPAPPTPGAESPTPGAEPGPAPQRTVRVQVGSATSARTEMVADLIGSLPPELPGMVSGLEAARPLPGTGRWALTYHGTEVQVSIRPNSDLPAGQAVVGPGRIEISAHAPAGPFGRAATAPLVAKALAAYGDLVASAPADGAGGDTAHTGGTIRPRNEIQAMEWAERAYDRFRADDSDVADIAQNLAAVVRPSGEVGFTPEQLRQIKHHLMVAEHLVSDYAGGLIRQRFDPYPPIAEAWIRLREGRPVDADLVLLEHELAELRYLREHPGATYPEAHAAANERYNWQSVEPERTGEDYGRLWREEGSGGDIAGLREDPGRQPGGGVPLRPAGADGPQAGHHEGDRPGSTAGRRPGHPVRGGVREDSAPPPADGPVAGERVVRGVTESPATGAPPHPVAGADGGEVTQVAVALPDRYPVSPQPEVVRRHVSELLTTLAEERAGGLEGVRPDGDGAWRLSYPATEVEVTVNPDLPAGHARVTPGGIELSGQTADGPAGRLITAAALARALETHGDLLPQTSGPPSTAAPENVIQAAAVPGGEFHGLGAEPTGAHRADLLNAVPEAMARAVTGHGGLTMADLGGGRYRIGLPDGEAITVRVETQWLGFAAAAESHLNHDKGQHVIQLSDQLPVEQVERALAHEIGEVVEDRARYLRGEPAAVADALRPGEAGTASRLSPHDVGRIQELRVLGEQLTELPPPEARTPAQQARAQALREAAFALVEHLGLRDGTPGAADRHALILAHLSGDPGVSAGVERLLVDVGRAEAELPPADRATLAAVAERAVVDQARLDAWRESLAPRFERPVPFEGRQLRPEQARTLADQATAARAERSAQTLAALRAEAAGLPLGEYPSVRLQLGGGASLAGRDPGALLVDDRGRWQSDNGTVIAQTADQLRNLNRTGIGDPYQFVRPGERVPLDAVRYWEDSIAAQGPVIDGTATLRLDEHGTLLADVTPADGSPPITLAVAGRPVISSGFPPEAIVGVDRGIGGLRGTFAEVSASLATLGTPEATRAQALVDALSWFDTGSAARVLDILAAHGVDPGNLTARSLTSLAAIANWHQLRQSDPDRVLTGDQANQRGADADAAERWVVAGTGGTAISGIENLLRNSSTAEFVMVGNRPPPGLGDNTQWKQVRADHDLGYDPTNPGAPSARRPDGSWPNPTASGRLTMVFGQVINGIQVVNTPAGQTGYEVAGVRGDGVIVSLGGRPGLPPAVAELVDAALKRDPTSVSAEMLFDNAGQYLGYRLTVSGHVIDVTGAASRFFPGDPIFAPQVGRAPDHPPAAAEDGRVWTTDDHRYALVTRESNPADPTPQASASRRDAPPESGNFDGGYVATAVQVTHYAAAMRAPGPDGRDPTPPGPPPDDRPAAADGPDLRHAARGHELAGAYHSEPDPARARAAVGGLLSTPDLLPENVVVEPDAGTARLVAADGQPLFEVRFETAPVAERDLLSAGGERYAPTASIRYHDDHAVVLVSENATTDHIRQATAAALAEIDAVVGGRLSGAPTDVTSALSEGSQPDGSGRYRLTPMDIGRLAAMRTLVEDLAAAAASGDTARMAQLRVDAVGMAVSYGLAERAPPAPVHTVPGNEPVVGDAAVRLRREAIADLLGDGYAEVAPVVEALSRPAAQAAAEPVRQRRAEDRGLLREAASGLIADRDAADAVLTSRVATALDTGTEHVFDRLIIGNGWAAISDYVHLDRSGAPRGELPATMAVGEGPEPWLPRGPLPMGQVPSELELRGLPLQPSQLADSPVAFTPSRDFGLAAGVARAVSGMPTYQGSATRIEPRPPGDAVGWPAGANYRVTVDGRHLYTAAVDVTTGPGPGRIPAMGEAPTRVVDPQTGASADFRTDPPTFRDRSGAPVAPRDLSEEVLTRFGLTAGGEPVLDPFTKQPAGPLLADGEGRLTDPWVVDVASGISVDPGTRELFDADGRRVAAELVPAEARARLGFRPDGRYVDPRFVDHPAGYSMHPVTGEVVRTGDRTPVDPSDLAAAVRDDLTQAVHRRRVQFGGEQTRDAYGPDDRVLVYGAGASGAWDVQEAAASADRELSWTARAMRDPAELEHEFRAGGGYNRRNTVPGAAYSPEVWDRTDHALRRPVEITTTTNGDFRVRFDDGHIAGYDRVVFSIGQEATYPGGPAALVAGAELHPLYGTGGEVHGLRDASGGLRLLGAAGAGRATLDHLPRHQRPVVGSVMGDQAAALPADSRNIPPSIRNQAWRIADVNLPLDPFRPGVADPAGHLSEPAGTVAAHLAEAGAHVRGVARINEVPDIALVRLSSDDPGAGAVLRQLPSSSPQLVGRYLGAGLASVKTAELEALVLDGRDADLPGDAAREAYASMPIGVRRDRLVRFILGDGSILQLPEVG